MATPQTNKDPKKNNDKPEGAAAGSAPTTTKGAAPPSDYAKETTDVVGYWDGDGKLPIHGVPQFVNLMDSSIDEYKPSALVFIRLMDPCMVKSADGEGKVAEREDIEAKPGDLVGVWFSAGMRDIAMAAGRPTYMIQSGLKDVGKPSKMKVYDVRCKKGTTPKLLPVREDRRKSSAAVNAAPFRGPKPVEKTDTGDAGDEMPF